MAATNDFVALIGLASPGNRLQGKLLQEQLGNIAGGQPATAQTPLAQSAGNSPYRRGHERANLAQRQHQHSAKPQCKYCLCSISY